LEIFCNAQQYNQTGVSWHSDWLRLRLMDQSQEILLGKAIFTSSEYRMTQLRRITRSISNKSCSLFNLVYVK